MRRRGRISVIVYKGVREERRRRSLPFRVGIHASPQRAPDGRASREGSGCRITPRTPHFSHDSSWAGTVAPRLTHRTGRDASCWRHDFIIICSKRRRSKHLGTWSTTDGRARIGSRRFASRPSDRRRGGNWSKRGHRTRSQRSDGKGSCDWTGPWFRYGGTAGRPGRQQRRGREGVLYRLGRGCKRGSSERATKGGIERGR